MTWFMDGVWTLHFENVSRFVTNVSPISSLVCDFIQVLFSTLYLYMKQPAHEKIGVVDAQWIVHQGVPSLGNQVNPTPSFYKHYWFLHFLRHSKIYHIASFFLSQGKAESGKAPWEGVCNDSLIFSAHELVIIWRTNLNWKGGEKSSNEKKHWSL